MSRVYAAYSVGGLLGPALGALGGIHRPFAAYLILLVVAIPLLLLVAPPPARRALAADRSVLRIRAFWLAAAAITFASVALSVLEGVLPLHFAKELDQTEIGALYVGASLVLAASAATSGGLRPLGLVSTAAVLAVAGIAAAGHAASGLPWVFALALTAIGIGIGNTGSLGLLVEAVPVERIVTALVVWSQIGIVGYMLGPLAGGIVAEEAGYGYVWLVPAAAAILLIPAYRLQANARVRA
jgi:hypothetical protein